MTTERDQSLASCFVSSACLASRTAGVHSSQLNTCEVNEKLVTPRFDVKYWAFFLLKEKFCASEFSFG